MIDTYSNNKKIIGSIIKFNRINNNISQKQLSQGICVPSYLSRIENGELFLQNMHITAWRTANSFDVDEKRKIKLLVHKNEILRLQQKVMQDGITLVPIRVYLNGQSRVKLELGICKGKHTYDKRESLKKKDQQREIERHLK